MVMKKNKYWCLILVMGLTGFAVAKELSIDSAVITGKVKILDGVKG